MLAIGDKVKVREEYVFKIAEKDFEKAKFLANNTGTVIGFDEITWEFQVRFEDREYWLRRFKLEIVNELVWYRFKTKAEDYRPLIDMKDIQMPWWCTGSAMDDSYWIIVCYLPKGEDLFKYWDDAYDIDSEERSQIIYTDRFKKPTWL